MKNTPRETCTQKGCTKGAYADGLCYEHYMERMEAMKALIDGKNEKKSSDSPISMIIKDTVNTWYSAIAVILLAVLWLAIVGSIILFDIYSYRYSAGDFWQILLPSLLAIVIVYVLMAYMFYLFGRFRWLPIVFILIVAAAGTFVVLGEPITLFNVYKDALESFAKAVMDFIKGIGEA